MSEAYYQALAPYYRLMHFDWQVSVERHAAALDGVIREFFGRDARTILDAACGIGTQSLGLAQLGYSVTGSDLSPALVAQARAEAVERKLDILFSVADMRMLWPAHRRQFDVVIACDNAVPHLLSDAEILTAFEQFHRCTSPGGGCIISVRDYAQMELSGRRHHPRWTREIPGGRIVIFDLWEFDGPYYDFTTYLVEDVGQSTAQTKVIRGGRYYCVQIATLEKLFRQAGFDCVQTLRDRFFQPLIVAVKEISSHEGCGTDGRVGRQIA